MGIKKTGSISLIMLMTGLLLMLLSTLLHYYFSKNTIRQLEYVEGVQQRELGYAAMAELLESNPMEVLSGSENFNFEPGHRIAKVIKNVILSEDNNFRFCKVQVQGEDTEFVLCQNAFIPSEAVQTRAGSYVISSYIDANSTTKRYMNGAAYSSGKTFKVPKYNVSDYIEYDPEDIKQYGFGGNINYYAKNLNLPKQNYDGDVCLVVAGNLTIANGAVFKGRTIFIVLGSTTINANVEMKDVFLLSNGALDIGSGCKIAGHLRTNMGVTIKGSGNFVVKEDAGREYQGVVFIE